MTSRFLGVTLLLSSLVLALVQPYAPPARADGADPVRVMLMGDSITHGSEGDWTWRYRLWRHLSRTDGAGFDLVGPSDDVYDQSQAYVDPDFDRAHASRWGNTLALPSPGTDPAALAQEFRPDVAVLLLGINDLTWLARSPADVVDSMRTTIQALREQAPGVDVVLARIPVTTVSGVQSTNEGFSSLAAELDTADERVVIASPDAGFVVSTPSKVVDTYDNVHLSSRGEVKVAAAVADSLAELGLGSRYPRPLPVVPLGPRFGAELQASARDGAADLTWTSSPGTTREVLWVRDVTAGGSWQRRGDLPSSGSVRLALRNQHTFHLRLRPAKHWAVAQDTSSNVVSVRPAAPTPGVPAMVRARGLTRGVKVTWRPVPSATSYVVAHRRARPGAVWRSRTTRDTAVAVKRLRARTSYLVRVRAIDDGTRGPWSGSVRARTTR